MRQALINSIGSVRSNLHQQFRSTMKKLLEVVIFFYFITFINCDRPKFTPRATPPATDARNLYVAMDGVGTDEGKIIHILTAQTNVERQAVAKEYLKQYNKDLVEDLKSELSGNFKNAVKALVRQPDEFLAKEVKRALTSVVTDDDTLAEVLCTRSRNELEPIMRAFQKRYNKTMLTQMDESLEGDKRTFYKAIITDKIRDTGAEVNNNEAKNQVNIIPNAADYCTVPQNHPLMLLFAKSSFEHIHFVAVLHEQSKGKTIEDQLKRWCNDDGLTHAYITTVRYAKDPIKFYAEELHKAMAGINPAIEFGTNDNKLIRIIVSRSEIDLYDIKNKYNQLYNSTLSDSVAGETSGDYKKVLLKVIEQTDSWSH